MLFSRDPRGYVADTKPPPLGDANEVRAQISKVLPNVDWKDPAWGVVEGNGWSIEFNHQRSGVSESVMLHVRGGGDPFPAIVSICKANGWVALDCSSGELINLESPSPKSWREFQGFRNQIVASTEATQRTSFVRDHPVMLSGGMLVLGFVVYWLWRAVR